MREYLERLTLALTDRYAIVREIGAGGMATVFLARDCKHDRQVALKVLDPELGAILGAERFLAEIRVTANLQHPNLLPLFDSGEAAGLLFYVMPFVDGESLRARLDREKQLPVEEAVRIASAVANALEYAHAHGVIHRDLKPENILIQAGQPVVADFGIALAVSKAGGARITQTGLSLGTPQYMSPEQATGDRVIDGRTDIYSLAAVTYEMLTGEPPHTGPTAQAVMAKLMTEEARPLTVLRRSVPVHVDLAVRHALEKLPADRWATAREFGEALQGRGSVLHGAAASYESAARSSGTQPAQDARLRRARRLSAGLAALCVTTMALAAWLLVAGRGEEPHSTVRFALNFEPNERLADFLGIPFALSPDGQLIAYTATRGGGPSRIYLRSIGELHGRALAGTEGALEPEFSPDGRWIAFAAGTCLKKVPVEGGAPVTLTSLSSSLVRGISWGTPNEIVLGNGNGGLLVAPAAGGALQPRFKLASTTRTISQRWPLVLADGKTVLFVHFGPVGLAGAQLWIGSLADGTSRPLDLAGTTPLGVLDDQLIYVSATSSIMAVGFDLSSGRITGTPAPVVDQVTTDPVTAFAKASMSRSGSLVYQSGAAAVQLVVVDARGYAQPLLADPRPFGFPRFSPDGRKVAVSISSGSGSDIWIFDRSAGTLARLTTGEGISNERPEWSPDGTRVLYRSTRPSAAIWWQPADNSGPAVLLHGMDQALINEGVISPDGATLLLRLTGGRLVQDLMYRRVTGDTTLHEFVMTPAYETAARFSPDGRWVAYSSDESGMRHVYVTPFPGPGPRFQVSVDGGDQPVWAPDGHHLYYVHDRHIVSASVTLSPSFAVTAHAMLFKENYVFSYVHASYDVSPDGKEFLLLKSNADAQTIVIHDWKYELKARTKAAAQRRSR